MSAITDPQVDAILHSQRIAQQIGANQVAVEVYGWAIKHAMSLTKTQLDELMDIVAPREAS